MTYKQALDTIKKHIAAVTFEYGGVSCGVDPFNDKDFTVWYGDNVYYVKSIDDVLSKPFFGGKNLSQLSKIVEFDY